MKTLVVKSSSKLKKNQEKDFVLTSLILNNIPFLKNDYIYLLYMENIKSYEILISHESIEIFDILIFANNSLNGYSLFIVEDIFLIFNEKEPYYIQKFEQHISNTELGEFVKNRFEIELNNIFYYDNENFKILKNNYIPVKKKSILNNINEKTYNQFKIFIIYLILLFTVSYFIFLNKIDEKRYENTTILPLVKSYDNFNSFYERLEKLGFELEKYNLKLKEFFFYNGNLNIVFYGENKSDIYKFLKNYNSKIDNQNIIYQKELKLYESSVDVKKF